MVLDSLEVTGLLVMSFKYDLYGVTKVCHCSDQCNNNVIFHLCRSLHMKIWICFYKY